MFDYGTTIYFVRHAETYLNLYGKMQGWSNAPLTDKGKLDARRSGKGLKDVKFDAVYTSDLQRTIDTAEILLAENEATDPDMKLVAMPEFREIFFGKFEGEDADETYEEVAKHLGQETADDMFANYEQFDRMDALKSIDPYGHAESFNEVWDRVSQGLVKVIDEHRDTGHTILIVAHGLVIRTILENLVPELENPGSLLNASVSVTHYDDGLYHLDSYGDVSHFVDESELD